ncbi:MAG: 3-phosphoshikimate 1-carboxyvinyltransferase [Elusimicrobia bacterium]|nr:3-phosphoshikimate 1-carboxyvinyltransferase [Elusimicrobiota bacterium]
MNPRPIKPAGRPLRGTVQVPGDKSIAHRALILGHLAEGGLRVTNLPDGADILATKACLAALGRQSTLPCGDSGTTMRLLMGVLAGTEGEAVLVGGDSLSRRPMARVAEPLLAMGAQVTLSPAGTAPVLVRGRRPLKPLRWRLSVPSAQVKSAVLLAALSADGETVVEDPFGTRDHTERLLSWLAPGIVERDGALVRLRPAPLKGGRSFAVPADPSSAAFFAAAAALVEGSEVSLPGVCVNPTRLGFFEVLRGMGARVELSALRESAGEPVADITVGWAPLRAARVPAGKVPALVDEIPLLAVVASSARGTTRLEGLAELRLKESDRLAGTAAALRALGGEARVDGDALEVRGPTPLRGASVETLGDHRLAMAFSAAALAAQGESALSDAACADKSYPAFFRDLAALRG